MSTLIEVLLDNKKYQIDISYIIDYYGVLTYKCVLNTPNVKGFLYHVEYIGLTQNEALQKISKALRRTINDTLEN